MSTNSSPTDDLVPKQSLLDEVSHALFLARLIFTTTYRHYALGPPAPSWTLLTSLATNLIRSNDRRRSLRNIRNPPRSRAELVATAQQPSPAEWLEVAADKLRGAIVKEVEVAVRKRELPGLLSELSAHETGERTVPAEWVIHDSLLQSSSAEHRRPRDKVVLFMHGGAHIIMSPKTHRKMVAEISRQFRCRVLSVVYRLSPGVVFPASTLDNISAYFYLTEDLGIPASDIIVAGDSAGGNLALTLMQYLRDADLPQVGAAFLACPWVDLSCSFSSWEYNKDLDGISLNNEEDPFQPVRMYLMTTHPATAESTADFDRLRASPYVSQALAPLEMLRALPPLLVQSGAFECFIEESITFVRRVRIADEKNRATFQVWTDSPHGFHGLQEDRSGADALREAGKWLARLYSDEVEAPDSPAWTTRIDDLLETEKQARIARSGPVKRAKPADKKWRWERSLERLRDPQCLPGGHDLARQAAAEARQVTRDQAEAEVFKPVRV